MPTDRALVDTNILVYALYRDHKHHQASRQLLDRAMVKNADLCITGQIISEFYSVITNHRRVTLVRKPHEAVADVNAILAMPGLAVISTPADLITQCMDLANNIP